MKLELAKAGTTTDHPKPGNNPGVFPEIIPYFILAATDHLQKRLEAYGVPGCGKSRNLKGEVYTNTRYSVDWNQVTEQAACGSIYISDLQNFIIDAEGPAGATMKFREMTALTLNALKATELKEGYL